MKSSASNAASSSQQGSIFLKDVSTLDCALFSPERGVYGMSWYVDVIVTGNLDSNHFVVDFGVAKKAIKGVVDNSLDHTLIIAEKSPALTLHSRDESSIDYELQSNISGKIGKWRYKGPQQSVYFIDATELTEAVLCRELEKCIGKQLPPTVTKIAVNLREQPISSESRYFYSYTHGLAGHQGLCQRPFHGHRSSIAIQVDESRRPDLEQLICEQLLSGSIHLTTPSQLLNKEIPVGVRLDSDESIALRYQGTLGTYVAEIPARQLLVIPEETSIECTAKFFADYLKPHLQGGQSLSVWAFEGLNKGSIFSI